MVPVRVHLAPLGLVVLVFLAAIACDGPTLPPEGDGREGAMGIGPGEPPTTVAGPQIPVDAAERERLRFAWDTAALAAALDAAFDAGGEVTAEIPSPFTGSIRFRIVKAPLMDDALAAKYPDLRTWRGQGLGETGRAATLRLVGTPYGFFAQVLSPFGDYSTRPDRSGPDGVRGSGYVMEMIGEALDWTESSCEVVLDPVAPPAPAAAAGPASWSGVRVYDLAVAATSDWVDQAAEWISHRPRASQPGAGWREMHRKRALAALLVAVSRVTQIFERELSIRFRLVSGSDSLLALSPEEDPFAGMSLDQMLDRAPDVLASPGIPGEYHVGHVLHGGGGGLSEVGCVCDPEKKAMGSSGWERGGDDFAVNLLAHELGHQFGAMHTFNFGLPGRNGPSACEPGSGSTIMGYAGRCGLANVQLRSDPYFHADSIARIIATIRADPDPGRHPSPLPAEPNRPPTIELPATEFVVPMGTPFVLRAGGATDPDGDDLTFCWEQIDPGQDAAPLTTPLNETIPLFRSFPPSVVSARTFPYLCEVFKIADLPPPGAPDPTSPVQPGQAEPEPQAIRSVERLPESGGRVLHFRLTVRDNRSGGGAIAWKDVAVTVSPDAGPFKVKEPPETDASHSIYGGWTKVIWDPARTHDELGVTLVRIQLTYAGGRKWYTLLDGTDNGAGEARVSIPNTMICGARIRVEGMVTPGLSFFSLSRAFDVWPIRREVFTVEAMPVPLMDGSESPEHGTPAGVLVSELAEAHVEAVRHAPDPEARSTAEWIARALGLKATELDGLADELIEGAGGPRRILYVAAEDGLPACLTQLGLTPARAELLRQPEVKAGDPGEWNLVRVRVTAAEPVVDLTSVGAQRAERSPLPWADKREIGALDARLRSLTVSLKGLSDALAKPAPETNGAAVGAEVDALGMDLARLRAALDRDLGALIEAPRSQIGALRGRLVELQQGLADADGTPRDRLAKALAKLGNDLRAAGSEFEVAVGPAAAAALAELGRFEEDAAKMGRGLPRPDSALSADVAGLLDGVLRRLTVLEGLLRED